MRLGTAGIIQTLKSFFIPPADHSPLTRHPLSDTKPNTMIEIHVSRDGSTLGTFSEEQIKTGLQSGEFKPTDFAWKTGMTDWKPLAQWPEFTGPSTEATMAPGMPLTEEVVEDGPPWENRKTLGFFPALLETVKGVLLNPGPTFESMKQTGGFGAPLGYNILLSWIGIGISLVFQLLLQGLSIGASSDTENMPELAALAGIGTGMMLLLILFLPVLIVIGIFIWSGILHLSLMAVGGARASYETTFRVVAYGSGSSNLLQAVPICGGAVGGIWGMVVVIIGLAKTHDIGTGKAVLAYFLPVLALCLLGFLAAIGGGVLAGAASGN